jgi:L-fuconate dehydratase
LTNEEPESTLRRRIRQIKLCWDKKCQIDGLCEYVQHLSLFDYICVSGSLENRLIEYVDHLHEHFVHPVVMKDGIYMPPDAPGYSIEIQCESLKRYEYPAGEEWRG